MTRHQNPHRLLVGLEPPAPPSGLRSRCIAGARAARPAAERPDLWTRLWTSSTARWAWAGAVAALLLAHVALSVAPGQPTAPSTGRAPFLVAELTLDNDLTDLIDLAPLRADRLPSLEGDRTASGTSNHSPRS